MSYCLPKDEAFLLLRQIIKFFGHILQCFSAIQVFPVIVAVDFTSCFFDFWRVLLPVLCFE